MYRLILSALIFFALPSAHAAIQCDKSGFPVGGHIGIPTDLSLLSGSINPYSPLKKLNRVQIAWLPHDEEQRYRFQEVIDIDWLKQTTTQVDLYDGAKSSIVQKDIREVELLGSTSFSSGHLDIIFCMPDYSSTRGLVFAYYGEEGAIESTYVVPFSWSHKDGGLWFSTVVNEINSELIVNTFKNYTVDDVTDDVERTTGIRPPRFLAESLIQQNLTSTTDLLFRDQAVFFSGHNTLVVGNQIIITGEDPSIRAVHSVDDVYSYDQSILDSDYVLGNLDSYIGPISIETHGIRRPAIIIDGRANFEATVSDCVNGFSSVSANLKNRSEMTGYITIMQSKGAENLVSDYQSVATDIPCEQHHTIRSARLIYRQTLDNNRMFDVDRSEAYIDFGNPQRYFAYLVYTLNNKPLLSFPITVSVDEEWVKKIWNIDDIESLRDSTRYYCTPPGDSVVNSVDEIYANALANLTTDELASLRMDGTLFDDTDGDGSICNRGEAGDNRSPYIRHIGLWVRPNLAPVSE